MPIPGQAWQSPGSRHCSTHSPEILAMKLFRITLGAALLATANLVAAQAVDPKATIAD